MGKYCLGGNGMVLSVKSFPPTINTSNLGRTKKKEIAVVKLLLVLNTSSRTSSSNTSIKIV